MAGRRRPRTTLRRPGRHEPTGTWWRRLQRWWHSSDDLKRVTSWT
ncbi:hypothetical protein [Nonomuraea ceibae]|nr:hypothetical protein [Nonomuraea ceibae]